MRRLRETLCDRLGREFEQLTGSGSGAWTTGSEQIYDNDEVGDSDPTEHIEGNVKRIASALAPLDLLVYRFNADGLLDTSFGSGGVATITFSAAQYPTQIVEQSDGGLLLTGNGAAGGSFLARLTSGGALDTSFGSGGIAAGPAGGASSLALLPDGKIIVGGGDGSGNFAVERFNADGSLDTTFGSAGETTVDFGGWDYGYSIAVGPGGAIVIGGFSDHSGSYDYALARFTASGTLDTTFGSGEVLGASGSGVIRGIIVDPDGTILAGGDDADQSLWRFTASGSPDTTFAPGGKLTANSGSTTIGWALTKGANERVVLVGEDGGDEAMSAFSPISQRLYVQQDANYNVASVTDASGTVLERYIYSPYGTRTVLNPDGSVRGDGTTSSYGVPIGYQGMLFDPVTSDNLTPNRVYDPMLGSWTSEDPSGYGDGMDLYQSFDSQPTDRVDPRGTLSILEAKARGIHRGTNYEGPFGPVWHDGGARFYYVKEDWEGQATHHERYFDPSIGVPWGELGLAGYEFVWGDPIPGIKRPEQCDPARLANIVEALKETGYQDQIYANLKNLQAQIKLGDIVEQYKNATASDFLAAVGLEIVGGVIQVAKVLRNTPGMAGVSGSLTEASGTWLKAAEPTQIPAQIAEKLKGRQFGSWNEFRSALWKEVAADPALSRGFSASNRTQMAAGKAPFAPPAYQTGAGDANMRFNIHHRQAVEDGGPLYDMSNMVIVSPKSHHYITYGY